MPTWNLVTWNTQGDPSGREKSKELTILADKLKPRIVFIQEGGVSVDNFGFLSKSYGTVAGCSVGAKNERCNTYLLYDKTLRPEAILLTNKRDGAIIAGGEAGRTPAAAIINNVLFISWHSTANDTAAPTVELVTAMVQKKQGKAAYDRMVIGGDFNCSPASIYKSLGDKMGDWTISYYTCGANTQGKPEEGKDAKEIDYFIVLSIKTKAERGKADLRIVEPSDHHPVAMALPM